MHSESKHTPIRTYRDLRVYRAAYDFALAVTVLTRTFPGYEQYELAKQLRRCARSIPANIVEGWAKRSSGPEFRRYLQVAIGSCEETKFWLELSKGEKYVSEEQFNTSSKKLEEIGAMLFGLWKQWRSK